MLPEAELIAVGSRSQSTANSFSEQFTVPRAYARYEDLVCDADIDVVYIATPHVKHKENCLLCLDAGKAILYKKPFTINSGTLWLFKDEFEVGCTVKHAGYYLTWLTAFFGPAKCVNSFFKCLFPDKNTDLPLKIETPDFSVGCIEFHSRVVARLTCSIVAEHNHEMILVGDEGQLPVRECWDYFSPVYRQRTKLKRRRENIPIVSNMLGYGKKQIPLLKQPNAKNGQRKPLNMMDFGREIAELASAIREKRPCRLSAEHALHIILRKLH